MGESECPEDGTNNKTDGYVNHLEDYVDVEARKRNPRNSGHMNFLRKVNKNK